MLPNRTVQVPLRCAAYFLLLFLALHFAIHPYSPRDTSSKPQGVREYSYVGKDHPIELPLTLPPTQLVLESGEPRFSLYADDEWATLFPDSDGFTDLGPDNRTFLVSMVHQLHCLDVFRVAFVTNRTAFAHHVEHCLRYMLQIVLCNADTTLEADEPGMHGGRWVHAAGGVGSVHTCRDWAVLRKYLDEHPASPVSL